MTGLANVVGQVVFIGQSMTGLTIVVGQVVFTGQPMTSLTIVVGQVVLTGQPMIGLTNVVGQVVCRGQLMKILRIVLGQVIFTEQLMSGLTIGIITSPLHRAAYDRSDNFASSGCLHRAAHWRQTQPLLRSNRAGVRWLSHRLWTHREESPGQSKVGGIAAKTSFDELFV